METFFMHLLKSSLVLLLFLGTYHLFLKRETFFMGNRLFLILGLASSFIVPFITITKTVYVQRAPMTTGSLADSSPIINSMEPVAPLNGFHLILLVYLLGVLYFGFRLLFQIRAIQKIKKKGDVLAKDNCYHVRTQGSISPFSFFKHIFYYPNQFTNTELNAIINHEKVHVQQLHSLDILFIEIIHILLWFNPAVWLYKIALKQNLEFIADSEACGSNENKKEYQYLMLKQAMGNHKITIANPFFNSIIKKRIVMLNQTKSKRVNLLKLLLILPFLGLFLVGFNTKEVVKFSEPDTNQPVIEQPSVIFASPLKMEDIQKVSSGFGPAKNPFTQAVEFHNGIDLVASPGKNVMASADGKVEVSASSEDNGNYIIVKHKDAYSTKYLHLKDRSVAAGDKVSKGQVIGHVGNTGKSTGPHLHFEVSRFNEAINPESLIPFKRGDKKVPLIKTSEIKSIELIINKNTTDAELKKMKQDLAKDHVDLSYTVVHNDAREIIDISIQVSGKGKNGGSFSNSYNASDDGGISPLVIYVDRENNLVSIGSKGTYKRTKIGTSDKQVWISAGGDEEKEIIIKKENGTNTIYIDGEEVDKKELHERNIKISIDEEGEGSNTFIIKDSDDDNDFEVISEDGGFFFIDTDGKNSPLYIINGKKSNQKAVKKLSPNKIESIEVLKGDAAEKKYGKDGKDGVVEITTKK